MTECGISLKNGFHRKSSNEKCEGMKKKMKTNYAHLISSIRTLLFHFSKLFFRFFIWEMVPPPSGDQDWQFDKFHDGGAKGIQYNSWKSCLLLFVWIELVLNAQLKRYKRFLATHKQALRRIEDTLGTNVTQTWDFDLNPVELKVWFSFFNHWVFLI